jgi:hypothetical protein
MTKNFLIINKGTMEVYDRDNLLEVAEIVRGEKGLKETYEDLNWQLKRTDRWDREDGIITVIFALGNRED